MFCSICLVGLVLLVFVLYIIISLIVLFLVVVWRIFSGLNFNGNLVESKLVWLFVNSLRLCCFFVELEL